MITNSLRMATVRVSELLRQWLYNPGRVLAYLLTLACLSM
jgi:hypothetical protein